jgi:hypothetical protein
LLNQSLETFGSGFLQTGTHRRATDRLSASHTLERLGTDLLSPICQSFGQPSGCAPWRDHIKQRRAESSAEDCGLHCGVTGAVGWLPVRCPSVLRGFIESVYLLGKARSEQTANSTNRTRPCQTKPSSSPNRTGNSATGQGRKAGCNNRWEPLENGINNVGAQRAVALDQGRALLIELILTCDGIPSALNCRANFGSTSHLSQSTDTPDQPTSHVPSTTDQQLACASALGHTL